VHHETDGAAALKAIRRLRPSAIVLDIGLPSLDGRQVCRELRAAGDITPILFLSARDEDVDRILGLELGGDDYVTKPFSPREVVARINALLRRLP
jgi:two-component system, OmpR family, response regulator